MSDTLIKLIESWHCKDSKVSPLKDILNWIKQSNENISASVLPQSLKEDKFWFYDKQNGVITNKDKAFFTITGIKNGDIVHPIIVQDEIGYLGIICKEIDGILHFLMQAKIEPGNINKAQISPTVQATKSNFTQRHRGKKTNYLDYFRNCSQYEIVVDQIQSEQSLKFYKKRNRNIIIRINEDIKVLDGYHWMTLGQIKELLSYDNIINMDSRTVISCIPFSMLNLAHQDGVKKFFSDKSLYNSLYDQNENTVLTQIYNYLNEYKMFAPLLPQFIPLHKMDGWAMDDYGISCNKPFPFKASFYKISIEGREVFSWSQPLFDACQTEINALFVRRHNDKMEFLIQAKAEIGSFDKIELAPTVQCAVEEMKTSPDFAPLLSEKWTKGNPSVLYDVILSEEGGRFYHTQNHNVIILLNDNEAGAIPKNYFWVDYKTLIVLLLNNNYLNEQLRTLLSLIRI